MLNNNKTYDNRNLRDRQKVFNDGIVNFFIAEERVLIRQKAHFYFSKESVSYEKYIEASQNSERKVIAIGVPAQSVEIEHGDIALINDTYYVVDHVQYKDYNRPTWYKVFLNESTIPFIRGISDEEV